MTVSRYASRTVGMCPSTLAPNPRSLDAEAVKKILRACSETGFNTLSYWPHYAELIGLRETRSLLKDLEMNVRAIEAISAWADGPDMAVADTSARLELANALDADILLAATIDPELDVNRAVEGIARACELASDCSVRVAIEFIPGTAIPDLATAWDLARASGSSNAGVVVDMLHWHHQPGGPDYELLRSIPAERIQYVQICDSDPGPTPPGKEYVPYAMTARALPGEGVVDIHKLLATLDEMGAEPYFAAEVFNTNLALTGVDNMTRALRRAVDAVFA